MAAFDGLLATDADIATKAASDYHILVPAHQRAAFGTDGTLFGWDLSTGANLTGLTTGHVVRVQKGNGGEWSDLLAVDSVASGVVTLRRIGMDAGDGPPPTPPAGTLNFYAPTARPQIARATAGILRRFGFADYDAIGQAIDGAGSPEHFRDLATLDVLLDLLWTQHRAGASEENFHTKYRDLIAERDALKADLIDQYAVSNAKPLVPGVLRLPTYRPARSEF